MPLARVNGTELFYTIHGHGSPVMLMHGGLGFDHTYFRPWMDPLGDRFQLIYYDHRGNGRSDRAASLDSVDHDTWARDADALREHLGLERVILLGQSYGGSLAQEYALRFPERLDGLILVSTYPAWDYVEVIEANARARGTPEQVDIALNRLSKPVSDDETLKEMLGAIFPLYFHRYDPAVGEAIGQSTRFSAKAFNRGFVECLPQFNLLSRLGEIETPTLVIGGRHDWITPLKQGAERIHSLLPNSKLVVFEHSGHLPMIEEQAKFLQVFREWTSHLHASS